MEEKKYINRLAEKELIKKINSSGCVVVTGPKFCGKSTMCERYAKSIMALKTSNSIELVSSDPKIALDGKSPRLIDEWQKVPEIWNLIKADLDEDYVFGKYILTGSTTPVNPSKIQHSGAGRISRMILRPFSLYESKESTGDISLSEIFEKGDSAFKTIPAEKNNISLSDIAFYICRGGWPVSVKASKEYAINVTENYYDGLFTIEDESDEFAYFLKGKNIDLLQIILKSYARNISTEAKNTLMINDILNSGFRKTLDDDTYLSYVKTLTDLFIIYDMPAWNLNLRTSVAVRTSPTHHFVDTSIATACLGIKPADLLADMKSFGFFFEDFAIRDLLIYAETFNAKVKHYRDSSGQEVDAIIELENSDYCAVEIKIYSPNNIEDGKKSLKAFEEKLIRSNLKPPKFKMIITSHGDCKKEDGIYIIPIGFLKN